MSRHGLGLGLGGLGRDRGFLYRDIVLLALCRDRGWCHDKMWSRSKGLVSKHRNCVATERCNESSLCAVDEFCRDRDRSTLYLNKDFCISTDCKRNYFCVILFDILIVKSNFRK